MADIDTSPAALRALATELALIPPRFRRRPLGEAAATLRALAAEKEAGAPAPDGWTPWRGGEQPVPDDVRVEIVLRDDDENQARAGILDWRHFNAPNDIIAYRIVGGTRP